MHAEEDWTTESHEGHGFSVHTYAATGLLRPASQDRAREAGTKRNSAEKTQAAKEGEAKFFG
jgi:hypothetical protein